jgi:hypothetical protein
MLDAALAIGERIDAWARQTPHDRSSHDATLRGLIAAVGEDKP